MQGIMLRARSRLASLFSENWLRLGTDLAILVATGYLILKKTIDLSITDWLLENAFKEPLVELFVTGSVIVIVVAFAAKIGIVYFDYFPGANHGAVEPDEISDCLYRMNAEIGDHLKRCNIEAPVDIRSLCDQHGFRINVGLVVDSLAEHIRKSLRSVKIKKKDVFISLYSYDEDSDSLEYILHFDPKRDLVETRRIRLGEEKFGGYASVRCLKSENTTAFVLSKSDYARGASKRYETIEHYMGCKIISEDAIFGFLNIEFHNNTIFSNESEMQDFMEEHVYPFKLLLEYQFLKRALFFTFKDFDSYWRAV